jgi:hypothetical protein
MNGSAGTIRLGVKPAQVFRVLAAATVLILVVSLVGRLLFVTDHVQSFDYSVNELFNVDAEANPPTWFGSMMLFTAALLSLAVAGTRVGIERPAWYLFAATLTLMSVDEAATLHEQAVSPLRDALDTSGIFYFAWVLIGIPFVIGMGVVLRPLFRSLTTVDKRNLMASGTLYFAGALGGEMVSGLAADDQESVAYVLITHVEEGLEFFGAALLIYSLTSIIVSSSTSAALDSERPTAFRS